MKDLSKVYDMKVSGHYETEEYVFFWSGPFSNWHPSKFVMNHIEFNCSEQAMMYYKAREFNDLESMEKILKEPNPSIQKKLGRQVSNYNEEHWESIREELSDMYLIEKFYQNPDLREILDNTGDKILVESSPYDTVWGIGMGADKYPEILDQSNWNGLNLLGESLMRVRSSLREFAYESFNKMSDLIREEIDNEIIQTLMNMAKENDQKD